MATLTLTSWNIINGASSQEVASNVNPTIRQLAFGDSYQLLLLYTTDVNITSDLEVRFNPGLFVNQGFQDSTNLNIPTETYYFKKKGLTTGFTPMQYVGVASAINTGRNNDYEIKKVTSTTFQIRLTFFMTADVASYFGAKSSNQFSRLTSDLLTVNPSDYSNSNNSIYTTNQALDVYTLGVYTSIITKQKRNVGFAITTGVTPTPTSGFVGTRVSGLGDDFLVDGWNNPCGLGSSPIDVEITIYQDNQTDYTFTATLDPTATTASALTFTSSVNYPVSLNGRAYVADLYLPDCDTTFRYGIKADDIVVKDWQFLNIDGLFVNEGLHTNRVFTLLRSATPVTTLNTTNTTTIQFDFEYAGTAVNEARFWLIPTNIVNDNTTDWEVALQRQPIQFSPIFPPATNLGGNNWRLNLDINPVTLGLSNGQTFHILYVLYDYIDNYYASYSLQDVRVSNQIEIPTDGIYKIVDITGELHTYKSTFPVDYLEVSPLQRVAASVRYDKTTYNTVSNFNRVQRIEATLETSNGSILDSTFITVSGGVGQSTNANVDVLDNPGALNITWKFRIEHEYTLEELTIRWKFISLTEPTQTIFLQKFKVTDYEQNKPIVEQKLTDINFFTLDGFELGDNDRNCDGGELIVETVRDSAAPNYGQAAVWLDGDFVVEEEDGFIPGQIHLPRLYTAYQRDVEEQFSTVGGASSTTIRHKIKDIIQGDVGMVGYPPPLPRNTARIMLHHTNPNGRNITFVAQEIIASGAKSLFNLGGIATTADYRFRVGTLTTSQDANNVAWGAFTSITFTAFIGLTIPSGTVIRVEYVGTASQTDIVSYIQYFTDTAPSYPKGFNKVTPSDRLANNDLMLYTGADTTYLNVTTNTTLRFTEKRTAAEIIASGNFTDFVAGETAWQPPNATQASHIYLQPRAIGGFNNLGITVSTTENVQLSTYATPLTNLYYPTTPNGVNPPAVNFGRINDTSQANDAAFVAFMNIFTMAVGERRTVVFRNNYRTTNNYQLEAFQIGRSGGLGMFVGNGCSWGTTNNQYVVFDTAVNNSLGVHTTVFTIERPPSLTSGNPHNFIKKYVNGRLETTLDGAATALTTNPMSDNNFGNNFANRPPWAMEFIAFFNRHLTAKEIREVSLGSKATTFGLNPQYAWDYGQIVNTNQIPHVGSLTAPNLVLSNHTNTLGTLFL